MSDVKSYLWLIPVLPLLASAVTAFLGPRVLRQNSHWPCVVLIPLSCVLSVMAFLAVRGENEPGAVPAFYYPWIQAGSVDVGMTLRADALTTMMLVMMTFISSFIAIYSIGYMHGDPG